jgi:hypothetical protein
VIKESVSKMRVRNFDVKSGKQLGDHQVTKSDFRISIQEQITDTTNEVVGLDSFHSKRVIEKFTFELHNLRLEFTTGNLFFKDTKKKISHVTIEPIKIPSADNFDTEIQELFINASSLSHMMYEFA